MCQNIVVCVALQARVSFKGYFHCVDLLSYLISDLLLFT